MDKCWEASKSLCQSFNRVSSALGERRIWLDAEENAMMDEADSSKPFERHTKWQHGNSLDTLISIINLPGPYGYSSIPHVYTIMPVCLHYSPALSTETPFCFLTNRLIKKTQTKNAYLYFKLCCFSSYNIKGNNWIRSLHVQNNNLVYQTTLWVVQWCSSKHCCLTARIFLVQTY